MTSRARWEKVKFGDVVRNVSETVADPASAGLERAIGLEHLDPGELTILRWAATADGLTFNRLFRAGQVLYGRRRVYQRKAAVANFAGVCSGDIYVFEPSNDRLLSELLPFLVHSEPFHQYALRTSAGSLSPRTKWVDLQRYEFDLPPIEQQREIAELLWAVEAAIRATLGLVARADALLQVALREHFDASDSQIALERLFNEGQIRLLTGPFGHVLKAHEYTDFGVPVINPTQMKGGRITPDGPRVSEKTASRLSKFRLKTGDLVLGRKGEVGRAVRVLPEEAGYILGSDCIAARLTESAGIDGDYLYWFFRSPSTMRNILRRSPGTTMPGMNEKTLRSLSIPRPSRADQERSVALFTAIAGQADHVREHITRQRVLRAELTNHLLGSPDDVH